MNALNHYLKMSYLTSRYA